jgi:hypothetical protein
MPRMNCPKCDADVSHTYEGDDWSCGITAGWFCDPCDLGIADDRSYEPTEGDVQIMPAGDKPLGKPLSELSGQPGPANDPGHPNHARYAEFCRIAKSWGHE